VAQTNVTSGQLLAQLRSHYLPDERRPAGVFAPEIQAPGTSLRRADLIWLGTTAATGYRLIGHEIKVSRKDLLAELNDYTKSHPWQQYCHYWYLVVPDPALIDGLHLPPTWGVLSPPSGRRTRTMSQPIPAPLLSPAEQAPAMRTLATWLQWRHHELATVNQQQQRDLTDLTDRYEELQLRLRECGGNSRLQRQEQVVRTIVRALGGAALDGQIGDWDTTVSVEDVIAALKDLASVHHLQAKAQQTLTVSHSRLRQLRQHINHALRQGSITDNEATHSA
jgi:hypothetical protein